MKTKVITAILLLMMAISAIYASEDPTEQAEYLQKKQQLDLLAERFKAETGFEGKIEYDYTTMKLSRYRGVFSDVHFSNPQDTTSLRQSFSSVKDKMLPYLSALDNQLYQTRIELHHLGNGTRYIQLVNGYPVEHGGYLNMTYSPSNNLVDILDVTAEIADDSVRNILPLQQIVDNVISYHKDKYKVVDREIVPYGDVFLKYSNIGTPQYKLTFIIVLDDITYYVDAYSGIICGAVSYVDDLSSVLVKGKVYDPCITNFSPEILDNALAMQGIDVVFNGIHGYTDSDGIMTFPDSLLTSYEVFLKHSSYRISDYADSLTTLRTSDYNYMNHIYETVIGDSSRVNGVAKLCYAPNIFAHADAQIAFMKKLYSSYNANLQVITNYQFSNPNLGGQISYNTNKIRLKTGLIPNYLNHEFGHHFVWNALSTDFATQSLQNAMDESFAHYLSCVSIPWAKLIYPNGNNQFIYDLSLSIPIDVWATTIGLINEDKYCNYLCGLNIASAWWSLRNDTIFGLPNPDTSINAFDDLLAYVLRNRVNSGSATRYKPRYFYNLLMNEVATNGQTTGLNDKQRAIDAAYSSRGLHFNPQVESISSMNKTRNIFNLNEPVHVKVSNCPQNTRINIYVIKHGDYPYLDGALTSNLSDYYAHGFTPNTTAITNSSGEWSGLIWTTPSSEEDALGDYDIIVDIGSPTTPDGIIHFTFSAANVLDGIDGRTQPGFRVENKNIDVVMTEQASAEATTPLWHK